MIFLASPSTMAVLPTPGSPRIIGLFLVRRERIWMMRLISSSRPMTGSTRSWNLGEVRLLPKSSKALAGSSSKSSSKKSRCFFSAALKSSVKSGSLEAPFRVAVTCVARFISETFRILKSFFTSSFSLWSKAAKRCSVPTYLCRFR